MPGLPNNDGDICATISRTGDDHAEVALSSAAGLSPRLKKTIPAILDCRRGRQRRSGDIRRSPR